jgi:hypothetical protein
MLFQGNEVLHIDFTFNKAPNGRHSYFIGRDDTLQARIRVKPSTSSTASTRTNFDFSKLIFNHESTSKHNKKQRKWKRWFCIASQKIKVSSTCHYSQTSLKKHDKSPLSTIVDKIILKASLTKKNKKLEGINDISPYPRPRELLKKL